MLYIMPISYTNLTYNWLPCSQNSKNSRLVHHLNRLNHMLWSLEFVSHTESRTQRQFIRYRTTKNLSLHHRHQRAVTGKYQNTSYNAQ